MMRWRLLSLLALVITVGLFVTVAFAAHSISASPNRTSEANTTLLRGAIASIHNLASTRLVPPTPCPLPYHYLVPEAGGPCNGCTVNVGDRFNLDMMVHSNLDDLTAQQAYLTFTYSLLENVRVSSAGCVPTNTITGDLTTFDATLQNEVCNGPNPCVFRGITVDPGSLAFASGALINCPEGCGPDFRVAQIGLCALAPGTAILHWQFSPPAPITRNTEIGDNDRMFPISSEICYDDYVIYIKP